MTGARVSLTGGGNAELDPAAGSTREEVVEKLTSRSLTGSAVPLVDATVPTADGGEIRYGDIASFDDASPKTKES